MSAPNPVTLKAPDRYSARLAYEYRNQYLAARITRAFAQLKDMVIISRTVEG